MALVDKDEATAVTHSAWPWGSQYIPLSPCILCSLPMRAGQSRRGLQWEALSTPPLRYGHKEEMVCHHRGCSRQGSPGAQGRTSPLPPMQYGSVLAAEKAIMTL